MKPGVLFGLRLVLAVLLVIAIPYVLYLQQVQRTGDRMLEAMRQIQVGMHRDQVLAILQTIRPSGGAVQGASFDGRPEITSMIRIYMGMVTSRNYLVYFDADDRVVWQTWEPT